jgi:hypothetical protein
MNLYHGKFRIPQYCHTHTDKMEGVYYTGRLFPLAGSKIHVIRDRQFSKKSPYTEVI